MCKGWLAEYEGEEGEEMREEEGKAKEDIKV
jgi:hypothetical protein